VVREHASAPAIRARGSSGGVESKNVRWRTAIEGARDTAAAPYLQPKKTPLTLTLKVRSHTFSSVVIALSSSLLAHRKSQCVSTEPRWRGAVSAPNTAAGDPRAQRMRVAQERVRASRKHAPTAHAAHAAVIVTCLCMMPALLKSTVILPNSLSAVCTICGRGPPASRKIAAQRRRGRQRGSKNPEPTLVAPPTHPLAIGGLGDVRLDEDGLGALLLDQLHGLLALRLVEVRHNDGCATAQQRP
jgi:hypothetical protein